MSTYARRACLLLGLFTALSCARAADRWELQYFHDDDKTALTLDAIQFVTANRGLAIGAATNGRGEWAMTLVTSDGGAKWTEVKSPERGRSLFCLDETACWMAGPSGIWFSDELGRTWRRIAKRPGVLRVHFLSRQRGWAIGAEKLLLETFDGGRTWKPMAVRDQVKTREDRTHFYAIDFSNGKKGVIFGRSEPPADRRDRVPLWMDDEPEKRRERPALAVVLQTADGGQTWDAQTSSIFGRISDIDIASDGRAVALVQFDRYFAIASEVFRIGTDGRTERAFASKDMGVTGIALLPGGPAFAAGFEPPGQLPSLPIPGKVKVLRSSDLKNWTAQTVDYRAVARNVSISAVDAEHVWIATDTGMILRLRVD